MDAGVLGQVEERLAAAGGGVVGGAEALAGQAQGVGDAGCRRATAVGPQARAVTVAAAEERDEGEQAQLVTHELPR